jgi:general secretion pathway protein D
MMSFFKASALRTLIVVLLSAAALTAQAQVAASEDGKSWTVNIRNADIQAFISQIADMTGKNFVVDPRVRARDVVPEDIGILTNSSPFNPFNLNLTIALIENSIP